MSQVYGDPNNRIAAIKEMLLSGDLTVLDMEQRLTELIEDEMRKPVEEIDSALLSTCENILWDLHSIQTKHLPNMNEKIFLGLLEKRKKKQAALHIWRQFVRVACMAGILLVLVFSGITIMEKQRLKAQTTSGGQKYEVQGEVNVPIISEQAQAEVDEEAQPETFSATNFNDIVSFLGYKPHMPTWIPSGWEISDYIILH